MVSRRQYTLAMLRAAVRKKGGALSVRGHGNTVFKANAKVPVRCNRGHKWEVRVSRLAAGSWCARCVHQALRTPLPTLQRLARERGGELLSTSLGRSPKDKLQWRCAEGHIFRTTAASVRHAYSWCPDCAESRYERIVRAHFEQIFRKDFPKARPTWLRNPKTGRALELDGYCEDLSLAFEHQGPHHYLDDFVPHWKNRSKTTITEIDAIKRRLCKRHGVTLIIVPELHARLPIKELQSFIIQKAAEAEHSVPRGAARAAINVSGAYQGTRERRQLERMQAIAKERGGRLMSTCYVDVHSHLEWKCRCGYRWAASAGNVARGKWCPKCAGRRKDMAYVAGIARRQRCDCLSTKYEGMHQRMRWRCRTCRHVWKSSLANLRSGHACPSCAVQRQLEARRHAAESVARRLAKARGGRLLSPMTEYKTGKSRLLWQCNSCETKWRASISTLRSGGTWCPTCGRNKASRARRLGLAECQRTAAENGGRCVSKTYAGVHSPMTWECGVCGYRWRTPLNCIRHGQSWCAKCARKRAGLARRCGIEECHKIARTKGFRCLSTAYENSQTKLRWCCRNCRHTWEASLNNIKNGKGCPTCARRTAWDKRRKDPRWSPTVLLARLKAVVKSRGGRLLTPKYVGAKHKLTFSCGNCGYKWKTVASSVLRGSWCRTCGAKKAASSHRLSLNEVAVAARKLGVLCLSKEYVAAKKTMSWRCLKCSYDWTTTWSNVKSRKGCPLCRRKACSP